MPKIISYEPLVGLKKKSGDMAYFRLYLDEWQEPEDIIQNLKSQNIENLVNVKKLKIPWSIGSAYIESVDVNAPDSSIIMDSNTNEK
jgi:hypothetical protein